MRRPMSIYRVNRPDAQLEFLYKCEGRGTIGMGMLGTGDEFNIFGPLGIGFWLDPAWKKIVVLGRGVGLATLAPLSQLAAERGAHITAILSARSAGVEAALAGPPCALACAAALVLDEVCSTALR